MSETPRLPVGSKTYVMVRYWASARAAAGTATDRLVVGEAGVNLSTLIERVLELHDGGASGGRLRAVLASCSVLVGEDPVGARDRTEVVVRPGASVEFLPPFAGG